MKITIYSEYFDPKLSRSRGRRISKESAQKFSTPALDEILRSLNVKYDSKEGFYPRVPWKKCTIYDIESSVRKSTLLKMVEKKLLTK
ncbi:MAG: signal recognition particle [Candidatus Thermoplasmatota archaeon]|jgi:signal recognition particle subunit SRP19|nr:signal recognition particle [Candidatus Thermoplasmatota archaeon]